MLSIVKNTVDRLDTIITVLEAILDVLKKINDFLKTIDEGSIGKSLKKIVIGKSLKKVIPVVAAVVSVILFLALKIRKKFKK